MNLQDRYCVYVNQNIVKLEEARVSKMPFNRHWPGHQRSLDQTLLSGFCSFDVTGRTEVRVECGFDFETAALRPSSLAVPLRREGNTVTFVLEKPCQAVLGFDGWQEVLHLFANPPEEPPTLSESDLYFGPGEHEAGRIVPKSGQTIYLDKDAVVYGEIYAWDVENVTVAGRGILDHSKVQPEMAEDAETLDPVRPSPIQFQYCKNIVIKDIVVRDPCFLAVRPIACENVLVDNIKIIGCWRYNSDGIDLINTRHGVIRNCFVRTFDDSICLKGFYFLHQGEMFHNHRAYDTMEDITVENCVIWNDWGNALWVGVDLCAAEVKDCVFRNCDVIHVSVNALGIANADYAEVSGILFEDIRVEYDPINQPPQMQQSDSQTYVFNTEGDYLPTLLQTLVQKCEYSFGGTKRGKIRDVTFRNIQVSAPAMPPSQVKGYDGEFSVRNLKFEQFSRNRAALNRPDEMNLEYNEFVQDMTLDGEAFPAPSTADR